jgi:hypothetical protein
MINRGYYGWKVLLGLFLNYMAVVGIMVYTLPLFYPSIIREFGFSSEQVTRPAFLAYMAGAFITPFVSPFYDRYSIRKFMLSTRNGVGPEKSYYPYADPVTIDIRNAVRLDLGDCFFRLSNPTINPPLPAGDFRIVRL